MSRMRIGETEIAFEKLGHAGPVIVFELGSARICATGRSSPGFRTADQIAAKLGIEKTAIVRIRAGISCALAEATEEGHCGLPVEELTALAGKLIEGEFSYVKAFQKPEKNPVYILSFETRAS